MTVNTKHTDSQWELHIDICMYIILLCPAKNKLVSLLGKLIAVLYPPLLLLFRFQVYIHTYTAFYKAIIYTYMQARVQDFARWGAKRTQIFIPWNIDKRAVVLCNK